MLEPTNEITKSPRVVCTVAEYFLLGSITVGGGVVRCSMQVTIPLSQPEADEVAGVPPPASQAATASATRHMAMIRFTSARRYVNWKWNPHPALTGRPPR